MPTSNKPSWTGKNCKLQLLFDSAPKTIDIKTWEITQIGKDHSEGYNGEDRNRNQREVEAYELHVTGSQTDTTVLDMLVQDADHDDAPVLQLNKLHGMQIYPRGGKKGAYMLTGMGTIKAGWKISQGGMSAINAFDMTFIYQYFKKTQ